MGYIGKKYVAKDWNLNWDTSIFQFEYHRLYYLTEGNGTIQLNNGISFTIEPHVLYFVPAYSIKKRMRRTACINISFIFKWNPLY